MLNYFSGYKVEESQLIFSRFIYFGFAGSSLLFGLFSVSVSRGDSVVAVLRFPIYGGLPCCKSMTRTLRFQYLAHGSVAVATRALEHRLSSCGTHWPVALQHIGSSGSEIERQCSCVGRP